MSITLPEDLPVSESGDPASRTALVLHGGGGPRTVAPIADHLASTMHAFAPTHPGWDGTPRPESIASVADLASGYLALLLSRGERDVVLIGSSIGGWIALEMAIQSAADERILWQRTRVPARLRSKCSHAARDCRARLRPCSYRRRRRRAQCVQRFLRSLQMRLGG